MKKIVFAAVLLASPAYAGNWNELPYSNTQQYDPSRDMADAARNVNGAFQPLPMMPQARQCTTQRFGNSWNTVCY